MTNNDNYIVKEYFDLNGHYLRLSFINNKDIHIISYNTTLLNGITVLASTARLEE